MTKVGRFQVRIVRDGIYHWDGGAMFGVVPRTLWGRKIAPDELNRIPLGLNCYLIETDEHTVLVETGGGDKMDPKARERMKMPPRPVPLRDTIAATGVDTESIDVVINTHLHWDHCSGNTILDPSAGIARAAFPRATYYTRRAEWEHAHERHPRDSVSYIDANYDPLVESGKMILIDSDREIVPGVSVALAPGHNSDMMIVTASSAGETFCFFSDLVPTVFHLTPTWVPAFDLFPLQTIETRTRLLEQAARENWLCAFGHDAIVSFARVTRDGGKFSAVGEIS